MFSEDTGSFCDHGSSDDSSDASSESSFSFFLRRDASDEHVMSNENALRVSIPDGTGSKPPGVFLEQSTRDAREHAKEYGTSCRHVQSISPENECLGQAQMPRRMKKSGAWGVAGQHDEMRGVFCGNNQYTTEVPQKSTWGSGEDEHAVGWSAFHHPSSDESEKLRLSRENAQLRELVMSLAARKERKATRPKQPNARAVKRDMPMISIPMCGIPIAFTQMDLPQSHGNIQPPMCVDDIAAASFTSVMLRNLPNKYTRDMLLQMLDSQGFQGAYTFVYLPIDFETHVGLGYAFVDLISPTVARKFCQHLQGFSQWVIPSDKVCSVTWSNPDQQGWNAHVDRYRNSPIMHTSVPDAWKPVLFQDGARVPFPHPTRKIRSPKIRSP
jgi:hypothetical protein